MSRDSHYSFQRSMRNFANAGTILIVVTLVAMAMANSPWAADYFAWWEQPVSISIGSFNLFSHAGDSLSLIGFINDALMAIFFFSVGLEIKREVLVGELSSIKHAMLPIIAAIGGMIVPVCLFRLMAGDNELLLKGSAIPMATDIAFSLGILSLLGKRVPLGLKMFLATLAVADDIGGILVIATVYTSHINMEYLLYGMVLFAVLVIGSYRGVSLKLFYISIGIVIWYLFLNAGIHPTIAGVLVAFTVPARPRLDAHKYIQRIQESINTFPLSEHFSGKPLILSPAQINTLKRVESASDRVISPLQDLEDSLRSLVNFVVIPLFAFANAGIALGGMTTESLLHGAAAPVLVGLVGGKFIGIFAFSYLAVRFKWGILPSGTNWKSMAGISLFGGIGFTVSIFIANLSYIGMSEMGISYLHEAKLGILIASLIAGIGGYLVLRAVLPKKS